MVNYPAQIKDFDGECAQTTYSREISLWFFVYNDSNIEIAKKIKKIYGEKVILGYNPITLSIFSS